MEVIGAGLGRTGTSSLKKALEILGYDPTYHMQENMKHKHSQFWVKVFDGEIVDFKEVYSIPNNKYKASCDWPSAPFWEEQLQQYPNAKVILTKRDGEKWFASMIETVLAVNAYYPGGPWGTKFAYWLGLRGPYVAALQYRIMQRTFNMSHNKYDIIEAFHKYNADVIARCPPEKLLVYEVSQGWEPLCKFLGKPIPPVPFPHVNDTEEFQRAVRRYNWIGYSLFSAMVLIPVLGGVGVVYWWSSDKTALYWDWEAVLPTAPTVASA